MYYENIKQNLKIAVTTETHEKFYVLIDPLDTISLKILFFILFFTNLQYKLVFLDELNKKITKTYQVNYKSKKIIESSYMKDFLLPRELV